MTSCSSQPGVPKLSAQQAAAIDELFTTHDRQRTPGCALGVVRRGKLIYSRGYGLANLTTRMPNGPSVRYDQGSIAKQFTAAAVLLLAQQGMISLDDEVRRWLPEMPAYDAPVTVRQLVYHTSGIHDYLTLFGLAGVRFEGASAPPDAFSWITQQPDLSFVPGTATLYSNSNYVLLAKIVERAGGKSFAEVMHERIFAPLRMSNTTFAGSAGAPSAIGYLVGPAGFRAASSFALSGDGGLWTTMDDLARWEAELDAPRVLGTPLVRRMTQVERGPGHGYGAGLVVDAYRGLTRSRHAGAWSGFRAELARIPAQHVAIAISCNVANADATMLAERVTDIVLAPAFEPSAAPLALPPETLIAWAGVYSSPSTGTVRRLQFRGEELEIDAFTPPARPLRPTSGSRFTIGASSERVEIRSTNGTPQLVLDPDGIEEDRLERIEVIAPSPAALVELLGAYHRAAIATTIRFAHAEGKLVWVDAGQHHHTLEAVTPDRFSAPRYSFVFRRDPAGAVHAVDVQSARARNIRFVKLVAP